MATKRRHRRPRSKHSASGPNGAISPSIFFGLALAAFTKVAHADGPSPFALPAKGWAGNDGNWSTVEFDLGSDSQVVNVVMGTALSEFWAVDVGGCYPKEPQCSSARAGLYDPSSSKDWQALGTWQLGLPYLGYGGAGEYGLDSIKTTSELEKDGNFAMKNVLMAAINTTDYFMGQFGLGITQGEFDKGVTAKSPLISAVQDAGQIPSYSYGYTAGAHYRDMPASVTLGGYDSARFEAHDDTFTINKADNYLHVKVRGIGIKADKSDAPSSWGSDIQTLSNYDDDKFNAVIDSSTPFLWFPDSVCDAFAKALDLDYDKGLDLYTLTDEQYRTFKTPDAFEFTFSLSSADNSDNFGDPLNTHGVVNITIPIEALVSTVEYPFNDQAIAYGAPAKAYFSLRRRANNETMVIGRSFLQESYLVTEYDKGTFSVHQAKFPKDPLGDAQIETINQPADSGYPPPAKHGSGALGRGEIAGIVVGASAAVMIIVLGWWFWRRRRNAARAAARPSTSADSEMEKRSAGSNYAASMKPASPLNRIFAKLVGKKNSAAATGPEDQPPAEVPNHEIFEMPVPEPPVELNGDTGDEINESDHSLGLDNQYMSSYEQARWRMDRQLAGPVPAYSPPVHDIPVPYEKAAVYDHEQPRPVSNEERARQISREQPKPVPTVAIETVTTPPPVHVEGFTPTQPAPAPLPAAPTSDNSSSLQGSMGSVVSPISPTGGTMRWDEPSPVAVVAPKLPQSQSLRQTPRSDPNLNASERARSSSPPSEPLRPSSATQRKPVIDPSKVVCLGPLPETYRLSTKNFLPSILGPDGERVSSPSAPSSRDPYEDTLGSNYTEEEDRVAEMARKASSYELREEQKRLAWEQGTMLPSQIEELWRKQQLEQASQGSGGSNPSKNSTPAVEPDSPASNECMDGMEFIHVPQPAAKRFSWEEDR